MNIWFRIRDKLITPELSDSILDGITRDSIVTLAKDFGIKVEERRVLVSDIIAAYSSGELKEVFGTGTAVAVNSIASISFRKEKMTLPTIEDSFALRLKQEMQGIQKGKIQDNYGWITKAPVRTAVS